MKTTTVNNIIEDIITEVEKLNIDEQRAFLTQLRAERLLKEKKPIVRAKNMNPLTMEEIDEIKHESRHGNAS